MIQLIRNKKYKVQKRFPSASSFHSPIYAYPPLCRNVAKENKSCWIWTQHVLAYLNTPFSVHSSSAYEVVPKYTTQHKLICSFLECTNKFCLRSLEIFLILVEFVWRWLVETQEVIEELNWYLIVILWTERFAYSFAKDTSATQTHKNLRFYSPSQSAKAANTEPR